MTRSPFKATLGSATVPKIYLPSQISATELVQRMLQRPQYPDTLLITGVRGSGKTALMMRVREIMTNDKRCLPIELEHISQGNLLGQLADLLEQALTNPATRLFKQMIGASSVGFSVPRSSAMTANAQLSIRHSLEKVKRQGKFVFLTIDEVSNTAAIRNFVAVYNVIHNLDLPLKIMMTGLPENVLDVQESANLTFFLRANTIITSPLQEVEMASAYTQALEIPLDLGLKMARLVGGYSFAFQLLGDLVYRMKAAGSPVNEDLLQQVLPPFKDLLFTQAYQTIYKTGSDRDRQYLVAINGRKKTSEVIEIMGVSKNVVAKCRQRALERRLVAKDGYGYVVYTLPYFGEFIQRIAGEEAEFV